MNGVVIGAVMALSMFQQTDTVIPVGEATLLDVEAVGGSITVDVWDRAEVRVRAEHSQRTHVEVHFHGTRISVEAEARRGPANIVDYQITVPASMDLKLEGMMVSITVEGALGNVEAETLEGDVIVRGGRGNIKAASMTGSVLVEGAEGLIDVESVAADIRVVDSSGEIVGETMGGDVILDNVRATSVDVGTVGGSVWYDGTFDPGGTYFFGSHGGGVTLVVPEGTSAQFDLSTLHGSVFDNLRGEMQRSEANRRNRIEVGAGGAIVEVETFAGRITVVRKGTEDEVRQDEHDDLYFSEMDLGALGGLLHGVLDGVSGELSHALSDLHIDVDVDRERRPRRSPGGDS